MLSNIYNNHQVAYLCSTSYSMQHSGQAVSYSCEKQTTRIDFTPCKGTPEPHDMSVPPGAHTVNRPLRSPGCGTEPTFLGYIAPEPRPSRVWPLMYPPLARWEPRSEQVGIKSTCRFNQVLGLPFSQNSRHVIGTFNHLTDNTDTFILSIISILERGVDPPSVTIPAPIQDHFKLPI